MSPEVPAFCAEVPSTVTPAGVRKEGMNPPLPNSVPGATLKDFLAITKALSDENRVRMLLVLRDREVCLCQLAEFIGLALSTASKHMSILRQADLVETRKDGRWLYYRLAGPEAAPVVREALHWLQVTLEEDRQISKDRERLHNTQELYSRNPCANRGSEVDLSQEDSSCGDRV